MSQPPARTPTRPTNNSQLAGHLNQAGAKANLVTGFEEQLRVWYTKGARRLTSSLGNEEDTRRLMAAALNSLAKTPTLAECTFESFIRCLLTSAEFRLYPGASGECAYVPFNNSRAQCKEATWIMQYQGACQLLYRSGMVKDIEAEIVCDKDYFDFQRGSNRKLTFQPADGSLEERGEWIGAYCLIRNIYGGEHIRFLSAKDIMSIKARSRASGSRESPWNSEHAGDRAWMWMKTVLKQAAKLAPRSAATSAVIGQALEVDEESPKENSADFGAWLAGASAITPQPQQQQAQEPQDIDEYGVPLPPAQPQLEAPPRREVIEIPTRPVAEKVPAQQGNSSKTTGVA